jgi:hypothetical protein
MKLPFDLRDTIAKRLCAAIILTVLATMLLNLMLNFFFSSFARPPLERAGLFEQAAAIYRIVSAAPPRTRAALAASAGNADYHVDWYEEDSPVSIMLQGSTRVSTSARAEARAEVMERMLGDRPHLIVLFNSDDRQSLLPSLHYERDRHPDAYFMSIGLDDGSWLVFTALQRSWGMPKSSADRHHRRDPAAVDGPGFAALAAKIAGGADDAVRRGGAPVRYRSHKRPRSPRPGRSNFARRSARSTPCRPRSPASSTIGPRCWPRSPTTCARP